VAVPLCILANYVAVVIVISSPWGSVFIIDGNYREHLIVYIVVSVVVGLALGLTQSVIYSPKVSLTAAVIGLVGVMTFLLAFTLVTQFVGIALGCILAWTLRRNAARSRRQT
jgi:hypothetical protein